MATGQVVVNVIDVGQGQCTFVEIYDLGGVLTNTLLFDCGTDKSSYFTYDNMIAIAAKIETMATPTIDCIFFSHSDKDHISLTWDLLQRFKKGKPKVTQVIYGGIYGNYTKNTFNILDYLLEQNYCKKGDIKAAQTNYSDYNAIAKNWTTTLWTCDGVVVYAAAANVLSDDPDWDDNDVSFSTTTAETKNRVSIVCVLYFGGKSYVICGDATNMTMSAIGNHFQGTTVFNNNIMTTMPHHGSRATGLAVTRGAKASDEAVKVVKTFAATVNSVSYTNSAFEKHRHPSLELLCHFVPKQTTPILRDARLKQKNVHRTTAYIDIDLTKPSGLIILRDVSYTFETSINTYTTRYSDWGPYFSYQIGASRSAAASDGLTTTGTAINPFASWVYTNNLTGGALIGGYEIFGGTMFTAPSTTLAADADLLLMPMPNPDVAALDLPAPPPAPPNPPRRVEVRRFTQRLKTIR